MLRGPSLTVLMAEIKKILGENRKRFFEKTGKTERILSTLKGMSFFPLSIYGQMNFLTKKKNEKKEEKNTVHVR